MDNIKKQIAFKWNESSSVYDSFYSHGIKSSAEEKAWKEFLKQIVGEEQKTILDVGTGTGFLSILLSELGHNCHGVDISEGMMNVAKDKAKTKGVNVKFSFADAEELPFEDGSYDIVINRHIVWTLPNPEKAINEWVRVLKPGGKLIIVDGDWFYKKSIMDKIKISVGKLLIKLTENDNNHGATYDSNIQEKLPMMKDENARNLSALIKNTGLNDVSVIDMKQVDNIEKENMPFKHRLVNVHKRICILGIKPLI